MTILPVGTKPWLQEVPAHVPHVWYVVDAASREMAHLSPIHLKLCYTLWNEGLATYGYDEVDMLRVGKYFFDAHRDDSEFTKKIVESWEPLLRLFYDCCEDLDGLDFSALSDVQLADEYSFFMDAYVKEYAVPLLTDPVGLFVEKEIDRVLKEVLAARGEQKRYNQLLNELTAPVTEHFLAREHNELMRIVKRFVAGKDVASDIAAHQKNWYWVQNNYYYAKVLTAEDFMERVREHAKGVSSEELSFTDAKNHKERVLQELASAELRVLVTLAEEHTHWQDRRKMANMRAQHYVSLFVAEVSRRFGLPLELVRMLAGDELLEVCKGKPADIVTLKKRLELAGVMSTPSGTRMLTFEESKQLQRELFGSLTNKADELLGSIANLGKVIGPVKVVMNTDEFSKVQQGDILVTSMTRPEFMPVLKKVAGIITDEGGITCHAAIVSRELGVPCILGTKVATRIFKDGDLVELNANHGVVRRV